MKIFHLALLNIAMISAAYSTSVSAETLNNDSIISLAKAGLGNDAIIAKIKSSASTFDLSTNSLISLKASGVADAVIAAMLDASSRPNTTVSNLATSNSADPLAPRSSGIYYRRSMDGVASMVRVDPTSSAQTKTSGGLVSAMTYGIAKKKVKTVLANPRSMVRVSTQRPEFYFYFDQSQTSLSNGAQSGGFAAALGLGQNQSPVTSPNEFSMKRFEINDDRRQIDLGSMGIGGLKSGLSDKQRVDFNYEEIAPGVYKVFPTSDLTPGEYGFAYNSAGGGSNMALYGMGGQTTKVFDFGVD
jgi:hypothetical protein